MSEKNRIDPDGTEMVDLGDADVSAVEIPPSSRAGVHERSLPPPLPPEVRASSAPMTTPSVAPPPPRSNRFYAMLIVGFVAVGVVVGLAVALGTRGEKKTIVMTTAPSASGAPSPGATGSVMMLPTIDMNDEEPDAGK